MKTIDVSCLTCGALVAKPLKEYNRSMKLGRKFFCNNSCGSNLTPVSAAARLAK